MNVKLRMTLFRYVLGFFIANMVLTVGLILLRYYNWAKRNARIVTDAHYSTDFGGVNTRVLGKISISLASSYRVLQSGPIVEIEPQNLTW